MGGDRYYSCACIKCICMLLPVFMAVARTADTLGVRMGDCQIAVGMYDSSEDMGRAEKKNTKKNFPVHTGHISSL